MAVEVTITCAPSMFEAVCPIVICAPILRGSVLRFRSLHIRTSDDEPLIEKDLCDSTHSRTTDSHKVNVSDFP